MKGLPTSIPDSRHTLTAFAHDAARGTVVAAAVFRGTHLDAG